PRFRRLSLLLFSAVPYPFLLPLSAAPHLFLLLLSGAFLPALPHNILMCFHPISAVLLTTSRAPPPVSGAAWQSPGRSPPATDNFEPAVLHLSDSPSSAEKATLSVHSFHLQNTGFPGIRQGL